MAITTTSLRSGSELESLSPFELEDELATLAAHISAAMCRWLELVGELDSRGLTGAPVGGSCAEWLAWRCALTPRSAREHVRVARALRELPVIRDAFSRGLLSYAKVRALTRVAEPATEAELVELAGAMTASQLERSLRAYRRVTTTEARRAHEREELSWYWDDDGSLVVRGRLAPEDGALFLRALESAHDGLWQSARSAEGGSAEPPAEPRAVTSVAALVAVADAALGASGGQSGGERYQVVVHVDEEVLAGEGDRACVLDEGPALAPETALRLACDASVVRLAARRGQLPTAGKRTRTIPSALRRTLRSRDRGCRFPGCENHRHVDAHHIRHWARGGETVLENLVQLCRRHHRLLHEGGYTVDRHLRFYDPGGRVIPACPPPRRGSVAALGRANRHLEITPATCLVGCGDRMDLDLAVDALLQISRRRDRSVRNVA